MKKKSSQTSRKAGLPPGTLVHIGEKTTQAPRIHVMRYDETGFDEKTVKEIDPSLKDQPGVTWINIDGLNDLGLIEKTGALFNLHPLLLEDIVNTEQRPKAEDFEDYIFTVLKMLTYDDPTQSIRCEQVSIIFGKNFVLSFQEPDGDVFEGVRDRIRKNKGRVCKMGPDFLAYSLMDAIVDNYFVILERLGDRIETLQDAILKNPSQQALKTIHELKRELIFLRRSVWPLRDIVGSLDRGDSPLIGDSTEFFLRDLHDHAVRIIETLESDRELLSSLLELYMSNVSNALNQILKVLTIITTIFIPLSFIAGVYGMNFDYMPELRWKWGYPTVMAVMAGVSAAMIYYFRKKKWI